MAILHGDSWLSFQDLITQCANGHWLFRGQANEKYFLRPVVGRDIPTNKIVEAQDAESAAFERFKFEVPRMSSAIPSTKIEWLALAQHHGVPTRLLDWSYNPLVAAWFACIGQKDKNGRIYALQYREHQLEDEHAVQEPFEHKSRTRLVRVPAQSARVNAQQGVFSLHGNPFVDWDPKSQQLHCEEIIISHEEKPFFLQALRLMGVNRSRLMTDIDALGQELAEHYSSTMGLVKP